ncbi:hypothetical protein LshimejAT787_1203770 [Lyophyllum shimeji]|uniref:MYND-type domain-containing protein n=1 Tax=Lyophyllum shimeji TaxID=47721 RepID=A0A9P3PVT1_LYOSH|nr:hypothetical protein LshimejAT787_1203770 [Lyophyllum shimeji]
MGPARRAPFHEHEPSSPYRIGKWTPLSTSDGDSSWGGADFWVRAQGAVIAKAIWFHEHFDCERIEGLREKREIEEREYEARKKQYGKDLYTVEEELAMCMVALYCSNACQVDAWKSHETCCGTEKPVPASFRDC